MSTLVAAPRFALGQIVVTPGVIEATTNEQRLIYLGRHVSGDYGCTSPEDVACNCDGIEFGERILSIYPINSVKPREGYRDNALWIIAEGDRSVTTLLLPSEY